MNLRIENPGTKQNNREPLQTNWENLANAIILQAVEDYRGARHRVRMLPGQTESQKRIREVERFFRSDWFKALSKVDGKALLMKLKGEVV